MDLYLFWLIYFFKQYYLFYQCIYEIRKSSGKCTTQKLARSGFEICSTEKQTTNKDEKAPVEKKEKWKEM